MIKIEKQLFGSRLKSLREEKNLTLGQTAEHVDIEVTRLQDIENSIVLDLCIDEVLLFSKLFKMDLDELIKDKEQEELIKLCEKQQNRPSRK